MSKRIVLVDDNPRDLRLFERGLAAAGFEVTAFATTEAAGLTGEGPDVLVTTDLASLGPTMARWTAAAKMRAAGAPSPGVLALLAADQRAGRAAVLDAGADEALLKPVPVAELIGRIEAICKQRAREALRRAPLARGDAWSGRLSELGLAELLSVLEEREQSGVLQLVEETTGEKGAIYLRKGKAIDAEAGKLSGAEALSRLARWSQGTVRFEIKTIRRADRLSGAVDDVLVAAARPAAEATAPEIRPTEAPAAQAQRIDRIDQPPPPRPKRARPEKRPPGPPERHEAAAAAPPSPADPVPAVIEAERARFAEPDPEIATKAPARRLPEPPLPLPVEPEILAVESVAEAEPEGELDALEARLRALELERSRLPMASQGISDDNAEEYVALLPDLPPVAPPAARASVAAPEDTGEAALSPDGDVGLDELASMFAEVGVGDLAGQGTAELRGAANPGEEDGEEEDGEEEGETELEASIARQIRAREAAERGIEADGDLAVLDNMTLPLGLAGVRGAGAHGLPAHLGHLGEDDEVVGQGPDPRGPGLDVDGADAEPAGSPRSRLDSAHASGSTPSSGAIDDESAVLVAESSAASPRKGKGVFDDLPGLTPLVAGADRGIDEGSAGGAPAMGLTPIASPSPSASSASAPLPAWVEGLGMGGVGDLGEAGAGDLAVDEAEALRALGIGGKRRILRFAALALGVAGILGGVGIHHAMAKRKAGAIAAAAVVAHPAANPAAGTPGPVRVASRELEPGSTAPTPEAQPRGGETVLPVAVKESGTDGANALARDPAKGPSDGPGETTGDREPRAKGFAIGEPARAGTVAHGPVPGPSPAPAPAAAKTIEAREPKETTETEGAEETHHAPAGPSGEASRRSAGPDEVQFSRSLATCRSRLDRGHAEQAARACREALTAHPDSPDALAVLAHAELNQKHLAQAITDARHAIALDPALAEPYLILGGALQDTGHSHEAGVAYRAYLARAPHGKYADELRVIVSTM